MSTSLSDTIRQLATRYYNDTVELRRHLHQNPELSFEEEATSQYIQQQLTKLEIPFKSGVAGTGIIATLTGKSARGRVIGLRADMDALPIPENTQLPYQSRNKGVMHACGHDAHTASLLATARILKELQDQWAGTLIFIFQPGEEKFPGGASLLLKEGALDHPRPELILGQHVLPEMESGHAGFKKGMYMASGDEVHLTIKGKGGHAAMPHNLNDTVLAACQVVVALQQVVSRIVPATIPAVLSFGRIVGNGATNVIPEKVELSGTLRIMDENWRAVVKDKIRHIATTTASSFGCQCEVDIKDGYPMVYNNEAVTGQAQKWAREYLGDENVEEMSLRMTAEDFGYYTREFPCTFYRFGVKQPDGDTGGLHTPQFNLHEPSLETSSGLMAWLAINFLKTDQTAC